MQAITTSKRDRVAALASHVGVTSMLERAAKPGTLLVINYHRIGEWLATPYDQEVFSATADMFDRQVAHLARHYSIVSLDEALDVVNGRRPVKGVAVLLTFDDGYIDCYRLAFPILRAAGVPATFFLVSSMIGSNRLPWWDLIAYALKETRHRHVHLTYPAPMTLNLEGAGRRDAIRRALSTYKSPAVVSPDRFLAELLAACDVTEPDSAERLFLDWAEAAEMRAGGMDLGSHTHTHRLLGKLSLDEQYTELRTSRTFLEQRLGWPIDVLAYPVGSRSAFNRDTAEALERAGYRAAFSFYGGVNRPGASSRFDLRRVSAEHAITWPRFRMQCALAPHLNGYWF